MRRGSGIIILLAVASTGMPVHADEGEAWVLGIADIPQSAVSSLSPAAEAALLSLPALVLERIGDLEERFVPEEEIKLREERARLTAKYAKGAEAAALRDKRDTAALSPSPALKRAAEERTLREKLEAQKTGDSDTKAAGSEKPLNVLKIALWPGHESGEFIPDSENPAYICKTKKLDYLIRWNVQTTGDFFRVRMEGWNPILGHSDFSRITYCPQDDVSSIADELAYAVVLAASAKPSARILIQVDPTEAELFVDDRRLASGRRSLRVYEERDYRISAKAPGFSESETVARPEFGETVEAVLKLNRSDASTTSVQSNPPGASLYLDGIWAGKTPVTVPAYAYERIALLRYPGYEELFGVLPPKENGEASFTLNPKEEGSVSTLERRKTEFNKALSLLIVSLPVSILTYGVYFDNALLYLENPDNSDFARRNTIWSGCFAASTGITASFAINAVVRLVRYVNSIR